jgi:glycosyltransferase involved in cell wall biosynthesis
MKKKIIYTIDTLSYGGAEKSTVEIVTKLSPEFEPVVVTFYPNNELQPLLEEKGVRVININLQKKYDFIKGISSFREICKREKPDLIVATLFRSEIISRIVSKQLGIKNIGTFVSDTYSPFALNQFSKAQLLKIKALLLLNRFTAKFCTRFISNANSIKYSNAKILNVHPEKVDVIYRGRDVSKFDQYADRSADGYFRFVNVGRLRAAKGQAELINAFAAFHEQYPYSKLDIAGEGPERMHLEKLIADFKLTGKVRLLGNVSNIPALLSDYHAFVFTSHYEGFSGALVEAMLAGIPILASDIPMNTEAIEHLKTGYIFKVKNIPSIVEAMQYAVNNYDRMSEMSVEAKTIAQRLYDLNSIVQQHEIIYKNCIGSTAVHSF